MGGHHLIMGELRDYITGQILADTHDERYRQRIARLLVEAKGFRRDEIHPRIPIDLEIDSRSARIRMDFVVKHHDRIAVLIKYGPGSLVTRHQVAFAAALLLAPYAVPFSLVTNGEDAHWLDNTERSVKANGLDGIWDRPTLARHLQKGPSPRVGHRQAEMATRILLAYEVDGRCPCDDTVCEYDNR